MNDSLIDAVRPTFKTKEAISEWLQEQANLLLQQVVARQQINAEHIQNNSGEHTAWVQSMAKFRKLAPINDKQAMLESLDERFK